MDLASLSKLQTEEVNPRTVHIDQMSTLEMCTVINAEDHYVPASVVPCLPAIAGAIDVLAPRVRRGGRVIYVGAGTSGRLGILDASEIPPTFAAPRSQFIGLIAGGDDAIRQAQEGAEDNEEAGEATMKQLSLDPEIDSIIGIASSGRTPYVMGCLSFAQKLGCITIGVVCAAPSAIGTTGIADFLITPLPGPEVVTGSTRLKAGTVTKLVLNMLSTGTMIRTGKTYGNMMVDLVASNLKLKQRSLNILRRLSSKCHTLSDEDLYTLLSRCNHSVKLAILVAETGDSVETCEIYLRAAGGVLANAMTAVSKPIIPEGVSGRPFTLCIDGGGTKCAAVVTDGADIVFRGCAGPCNLTDSIGDLDMVVATLLEATRSALKEHIPSDPEQVYSPGEYLRSCFSSVWVGLAGLDRAGIKESLAPRLGEAFGLNHTTGIRLTNDVDLLTAAIPQHLAPSSVLVLIAGTGSVAMRYSPSRENGYTCVARSGGWGHMLGDEGGGYAIGLKAIQHTLGVFEEITLGIETCEVGRLELAVAATLGCSGSPSASIDMLNQILLDKCTQNAKSRIASIARVVVGLIGENETADAILNSQIALLVGKTLGRLVNPKGTHYRLSESSVLILAGGLMKNELYRAALEQHLYHHQLYFYRTVVVEDAALTGARYQRS
ncbi:uncharacterized protein N7511_011465 [Penicillium nucicola]|uniref:uncharacterized protein n=1 Tax=Penicillium nucicola TaxID=1850975 RepID=UPI002544D786|nr:uncharacterized protein N7511_011465 [Penicillium nucicola]KAJ5742446.1 hypothetical protein N7511_011465 [Penicillium nucicola]